MRAPPWIRQPLVHFVILGLFLFGVDLWRTGAPAKRGRIVISAAWVEALREEVRVQSGALPDEHETKRLVRAAIEEELLVREALRLGLDRGDRTVRERLVLDLRFLGEEGSDEELVARARELGLVDGDPMVRRRLVELMDERIAASSFARATASIDESELAAFYEVHADELEEPARIRFHQVFVDTDVAGDGAARRRAAELRRILERDGRGALAAAGRGDDFVFGQSETWRSREELAKLYGGELATAIWTLPEGRWSGPVASNWGLHLVWIDAHREARRPPLDEVREEVKERIRAARVIAARERKLEDLARRYEIDVEAPG